jgi:eukaryotic-like serine/threonine-protein kinase
MSGKLPSNDSMIGLTVDGGRYEIVKLIGEGGMGRVFQARQVSMNRMVALKILRAQLASDEQLLARFQQEALSVSRLRHPNTITIFDYGKTEDGYLFMAMELLGGRSLYAVLRDAVQLALPRTLHIMEQVCGAVGEAHQLGIVHRDLKPENIQIDKVGNDPDFTKVLDFGIAKIIHGDQSAGEGKTLTMAGAIFGTPHYMSPEQVHGTKVDHRTDIYSLGIILYELLAGKPPFDGATPMAVMMAQASKPPPDIRDTAPDADVTDSVAELINECLDKDREKRLSTMSEFINRLQQIQYELGELTSTSARLRLEGAEYAAGKTGAPRPARHSDRVTPRPNFGPRQTDEPQSTPEHSGQLATIPPDDLDLDDLAAHSGSGAAKWVALLILLLGAGGGFWLWQQRSVEPAEAPVAVAQPAPGEEPVRIAIDSRAIPVKLGSEPPGATVTHNGAVLGTTPMDYRVPEGETHALTLALDGYEPQEISVRGSGESGRLQTTALVARPKPKPVAAAADAGPAPVVTAWLDLKSKPAGAEVYQGSTRLGVTPFEWKPAISDGKVKLRFAKGGYTTVSKSLELAAAGESAAPVEVSLRRRRRPKPKPKVEPKPPKPPVEPKPDKPAGPYQKL